MPPDSAANCDLCGREVVSNREEHYRGHLENAKAYIDLVERRGDDPSASETAREWIQHCEKVLAEPESGMLN